MNTIIAVLPSTHAVKSTHERPVVSRPFSYSRNVSLSAHAIGRLDAVMATHTIRPRKPQKHKIPTHTTSTGQSVQGFFSRKRHSKIRVFDNTRHSRGKTSWTRRQGRVRIMHMHTYARVHTHTTRLRTKKDTSESLFRLRPCPYAFL